MRIYICASYARKERASNFAARVEALSQNAYEVVSTWHEEAPNADDGINDGLDIPSQKKFAKQDFHEIDEADILIAFTEPAGSPLGRGGRHVETGYAHGVGVDVWIIGPVENIFHALSDNRIYSNEDEALTALWEDHCERCIDGDVA